MTRIFAHIASSVISLFIALCHCSAQAPEALVKPEIVSKSQEVANSSDAPLYCGGVGGMVSESREQTATPSPFPVKVASISKQLTQTLGQPFSYSCDNQSLNEVIQEVMGFGGIPILIDKEAKSAMATSITVKLSEMPFASGLQLILAEADLTFWVDALVIRVVPDAAAAPQGEQTRWVCAHPEAFEKIEQALDMRLSFDAHDEPFHVFIDELAQKAGIEIVVDEQSLEMNNLPLDMPVSVVRKEVALRSGLLSVLKRHDLTYNIENETLVITTNEQAEENLLMRIYWADKAMARSMSFDSIYTMLASLIEPDTWIDNGGQSRIEPVSGLRRGIAISTTLEVHQQIESFLQSIGYL